MISYEGTYYNSSVSGQVHDSNVTQEPSYNTKERTGMLFMIIAFSQISLVFCHLVLTVLCQVGNWIVLCCVVPELYTFTHHLRSRRLTITTVNWNHG